MIANGALAAKLLFDAWGAVGPMGLFKYSGDLNSKLLLAPLSFADLAFDPFVIAGTTNQKHTAKRAHGIVLLLRLDERVPYSKVFAKYAAAFFRISFSSLSLAISR